MILSLIYDCILLVFAYPRIVWGFLVQGKYRKSKKERFGFNLPNFAEFSHKPVIWIHSISVGETRAVIPLFKRLREEMPDTLFVISNTTETGHAEAKRSMPEATLHFMLPLDFSWTMRRLVKKLKPNLLILVEGDYWYHMLKAAKQQLVKVVLINGKISDKSTRRFALIPFFADKLFGAIDIYCVQNKHYASQFKTLNVPASKIVVTGNIKLDAKPTHMTSSERALLREELGIASGDKLVVIGSTGAGEEELLLPALNQLWKHLNVKVILVPRHPERFPQVLALLESNQIPTLTYTARAKKTGDERVILVDMMGQLLKCYQIADVAIVGGSFIETVGGHNIFEPTLFGVPVLFGPHMFGQPDLVKIVLKASAGKQVTLTELAPVLTQLLEQPDKWEFYHKNALKLLTEVDGATERTWQAIAPFVNH